MDTRPSVIPNRVDDNDEDGLGREPGQGRNEELREELGRAGRAVFGELERGNLARISSPWRRVFALSGVRTGDDDDDDDDGKLVRCGRVAADPA